MSAVRAIKRKLSLVVRLEGTNIMEGKQLLEESGLQNAFAHDLADAAKQMTRLSRSQSS
jgi:succinyl-CoA synthetase beta subunit